MSAYENLVTARSRIQDETHWTRGFYRLYGEPRYCSIGALDPEAWGSDEYRALYSEEINFLVQAIGCRPTPSALGRVANYNDNHTHAEVLQMYDKAIELAAEAEGIDLPKDQPKVLINL